MAKGGATNAMAVLLKAVEGGFAGANASRQESKQDAMARQQQTSQQIGLALNVLNADRQASMANQQLKLRQDALNQQMKHQTAMQDIAQQNKEATQRWREYQYDTGLRDRQEVRDFRLKQIEDTRKYRESEIEADRLFKKQQLDAQGKFYDQRIALAQAGASSAKPTPQQAYEAALGRVYTNPVYADLTDTQKRRVAQELALNKSPETLLDKFSKRPTAEGIKKESDIVRNLGSDAFAEFLVTDKDGQSALIFDDVKKPKQAGELVVRLAQNIQAAEKQLEETYGRPLTKLEKNNLRWPLTQLNKKGLSYYQQIRDKVGKIPATTGGPGVRAYFGLQPEERTPNALYSAVADALNIIQPSVMPINSVGGMSLDQLVSPVLELDQKLDRSGQILRDISAQTSQFFDRAEAVDPVGPVDPELEEALKAWGQPDVNRKLTGHNQYRR